MLFAGTSKSGLFLILPAFARFLARFAEYNPFDAPVFGIGSQNALQVESEAAKAAHEFLKQGPVTKLQRSRLTASQTTTVTIERDG